MVVTIVIIIILSTVTISAVVGDNGLIKQAEKTKDIATNSIAKENEDMNRLEQEYANMMGGDGEIIPPEPEIDTTPPVVTVTAGGVSTNSITVNVQAVDNESGLATSGTYKYYLNGAEKEASTSNSYTFTGLAEDTEYTIKVEVYDKAGNKGESTITVSTTKDPNSIENRLKEGDYVNYVDGTGKTIKCVVLYGPENANYSSYGIQIITMNTVEDITLGSNDFNTSMNSYNNAISTLNNEAMKYNNSTYSSDARCVGSVPNNKNSQAGMYTPPFGGSYSGKLRNTDTNYETDYNQMKALNIHDINYIYWLASHNARLNPQSNRCDFSVRQLSSDGSLSGGGLCAVSLAGTVNSGSNSASLRPVFKLKSGIKATGGNGTESSPYELGV